MNDKKFEWKSPIPFTGADADASWLVTGDSEIVETLGGDETTRSLLAGVCDLSPLPRAGGKGVFAASLKDKLPPVNRAVALAQVNRAVAFDGGVCCRLAENEILFLCLDGKENAAEADLMNAQSALFDGGFVNMMRRESHCQIGLCGENAAAVLSSLCALPPPLPGVVLQTRAAETSVLLIGAPQSADKPVFYLLADSGYAVHLWEELVHTAQRFDGGAIGWRAWREFQKVG